MEKYTAIKERAERYKGMLTQVDVYRKDWEKKLKKFILKNIKEIIKVTELDVDIEQEAHVTGLGIITIKMGVKKSGLYQEVDNEEKKNFFKDFGTLNYSQLFNGKVQVWSTFPVIEGLMEPKPPKLIGIFAPPEFNEDLILSNFETFLKDLIEWEDYDDDEPQTPVNKIGFGTGVTDNLES